MILNFKPIYKGDRIFHDNPAPRGESGHYLGMFPGLLNSIIERIANHIAAAHGILEVLHALVPYGGKGNAGKWAGEESLRLGPKVIQWEEAEALIAVTFTVRDPNAFVLHNLAVGHHQVSQENSRDLKLASSFETKKPRSFLNLISTRVDTWPRAHYQGRSPPNLRLQKQK